MRRHQHDDELRLLMSKAARGRDILRVERFGLLHWARSSAKMRVFPPAIAPLLLGATERHIMDVWKERPGGVPLDDLIAEVAELRDAGVLDSRYRCRARVVKGDGEAALSAPLVTNLQLTRACNLRCEHCFVAVAARPHPRELTAEQIASLFRELAAAGVPLVVLTGGEPMLRPDFWQIVDLVARFDVDAALCTNATRIGDVEAERLAASAIRWYSISLDGPTAELHDAQRGRGSFARAIAGAGALVRSGARGVKLRVTVTSRNADHLAAFARVAADLAVPEVVFKPFRRTTSGAALTSTHLCLSRADYRRAVEEAVRRWPKSAPPASFDDGMPESLPAWTNVTPPFGCVGGTTHVSVIYDGRVVACDAVFDESDWTLHEHSLLDAWRNAATIRRWREIEASSACSACSIKERCRGGCRARALAIGGSFGDPDPWMLSSPARAPCAPSAS